jgi:arylsulfatase A-like enzyme
MYRRIILIAGMILCAGIAIAATKPNVVLFLVDDMGWMDCGVYGSKFYETPHMDHFAKQAMRFTDAYAMPLCSPSRASILTGQYSSRHRVTSASGHQPPAPADASPYPEKASPNKRLIYANSKNYLDPKLITLAEVLRDSGYRTGHFGKWHLGLTSQYRPDKQGFETTWQCAPDPGPPSYFSPYGVHAEGDPSSKHRVGNITDGPAGEYITDRLTDEALKFIETHRKEPFFLNLWQYGVHGPWGHKEEYTAEFAKKVDPQNPQRNPIMASMLRSVDESLGRVLAKLDELGLTENTIFIFYSDNGGNTHSNTEGSKEMLNIKPGHSKYALVQDWKKWADGLPPTSNAPLREGKARIYEGGQRVPLMIRWPGRIKPGTTSDAVVGAIDLYPTVLDALGIQKPANHIIDGISFLPVLRQTGKFEREAYFTWFPHIIPAVSVRVGDWKLIRRFEPHADYPEVRELYNLKDDIGETSNLAEKMPEKVKQLDALIRQIYVMQEMGFGGFFMHSRTGLATEYLGPEWFDLINACADEAEKLGMEAWLYDRRQAIHKRLHAFPRRPAGGARIHRAQGS